MICFALLSCLALASAQTYEDKVGDTVDALWDKIEKAGDNVVTLEEMAAFFAGYDGGAEEWSLDEAKFVAGWSADFSMPEAESAAWFRCYDWVALDENTRVDIFDLAAMFDSVGFFGSISEEVFKASQRVWFQGNFFAVLFNEERTKGTGAYDDFISDENWSTTLWQKIDTNGDNSATLLEWLSFWTSKYCSEVSAVRIAAVTDVDEDGAISSDEWIATFLRLKAPTFYPSLEQLHFEEFMQYEQAALETPRPI